MDVEEMKRQAGIAACDFVKSGMNVGLGTGSTVKYTILELGKRIRDDGLNIIGVPTSIETEELAKKVGIPLADLDSLSHLDVVIDGADEYDSNFELIKGGGAALLREKIVAQASKAMVVVADERKRVDVLGTFPLPIEVTPFCHETTRKSIESLLRVRALVRMNGDGPLLTDNGNYIVDAHCGPTILRPRDVEQQLLHLAGVVQVGIFSGMCDVVVLATPAGVEVVRNPSGRL